jgi:hypothetical protein
MIPPQTQGTFDHPSVPFPSPAVSGLEARLIFVDDFLWQNAYGLIPTLLLARINV